MILRRILSVFFVAVALGGCATPSKEVQPKLSVRKIGLLPVHELSTVSLENKSSAMFIAPIVSVGTALDSRSKQKVFSEEFLAKKLTLGAGLTSRLAEALAKDGFEVVILSDVPRPPDDPDDIEYEGIETDADVIMHVYFDDVGLYSGLASVDYLPRVNIGVVLYSPKRGENIYDETLCYGVDASSGKASTIKADPKFAYRTFDDVMAKLPDIASAFEAGTQAIGKQAVIEVESALR